MSKFEVVNEMVNLRARFVKEMVDLRVWFEKYWHVVAVIIISVASVYFFYWVFTRPLPMPPYP